MSLLARLQCRRLGHDQQLRVSPFTYYTYTSNRPDDTVAKSRFEVWCNRCHTLLGQELLAHE